MSEQPCHEQPAAHNQHVKISLSCPSRIGGRGAKREADFVYPTLAGAPKESWPRRKQRTAASSAHTMSLFEVSEALAAHSPSDRTIFDELATDNTFDPSAADLAMDNHLVLERHLSETTTDTCAAPAEDPMALLDALVSEVSAETDASAADTVLADELESAAQLSPEGDELSSFFTTVVGQLDGGMDVLGVHEPPVEASALDSAPPALASLAEELADHLQRSLELPLPVHARPSSRNSLERKDWTAEEDETIRSSVELYGCKWRKIAQLLPGRSDDAVRNRWNRLKAEAGGGGGGGGGSGRGRESSPEGVDASRTPPKPRRREERPERVGWSRAEDATIVASVQEIGNRWHLIAKRLPERTEHAIRNRYHRLQTMAKGAQLVATPAVSWPTGSSPTAQLVDAIA